MELSHEEEEKEEEKDASNNKKDVSNVSGIKNEVQILMDALHDLETAEADFVIPLLEKGTENVI